MLIRDAQEEVRILYAAQRDSAKVEEDLLLSHLNEAVSFLNTLKDTERETWDNISAPQTRIIGMLLITAFELANEMKIDSLQDKNLLKYNKGIIVWLRKNRYLLSSEKFSNRRECFRE